MQQQGALAYQQVAQQTVAPRDLEADLLSRAAGRFQRIKNDWDQHGHDLYPALMFNRKLWTIFLTSVTDENCPHEDSLRQNIANLGIFVMNETRELLENPILQKLDTLININRQLAAGLREMPSAE
jgi:flagellar biosynthesis activator protein FlaF